MPLSLPHVLYGASLMLEVLSMIFMIVNISTPCFVTDYPLFFTEGFCFTVLPVVVPGFLFVLLMFFYSELGMDATGIAYNWCAFLLDIFMSVMALVAVLKFCVDPSKGVIITASVLTLIASILHAINAIYA